MLKLQLATIAVDEPFGICPNLIDMTDHQKDFLVTGAMKSGNKQILECVIEKMLLDAKLPDALDSKMFGTTAEERINDIEDNLYLACESLIQDAIDQYNDEVREAECEPARPDSDFH